MKGGRAAARSEDDDIVRQLREGGCPEEEIAKLIGQEGDDEDYQVWPENADALRAFLFCGTQWRVASVGGGMTPSVVVWLGLEYAEVRAYWERHPPADVEDSWWALQVLEAEAMRLKNERERDAHSR